MFDLFYHNLGTLFLSLFTVGRIKNLKLGVLTESMSSCKDWSLSTGVVVGERSVAHCISHLETLLSLLRAANGLQNLYDRRYTTERRDPMSTEQRLNENGLPCQKAIGSNIRRGLEMHRHTVESLALDELPINVSFLTNVNIITSEEFSLRYEDYYDSLAFPDHLPQSIHSIFFNYPPFDCPWIRYIKLLVSNIEEQNILTNMHIISLGASTHSRGLRNYIRSLDIQYLWDNGT